MIAESIEQTIAAVSQRLQMISPLAVAVSGGVDSMTLAIVAHRALGPEQATMLHAVSPAVPPEATERVKAYASAEGWRLQIIDAGEFQDQRYLQNPANRCFFCKTNLYGTMAAFTADTLVSGTNSDDLTDYRPGLQAAEEYNVRHPYVEVGIDKSSVRALAHYLKLDDLAELPAAPCLSSRIETGIVIDAKTLSTVNAVEKLLRDQLNPQTVRCRVRRSTISIELDPAALDALVPQQRENLTEHIGQMFRAINQQQAIEFQPYRMGSAFLRAASHA